MQNRFQKALAPIIGAWLFLNGTWQSIANTVSSPDGNIVTTVSVSSGNLVYSVTCHGVTVIETSPLGFVVNGSNLGTNVTLGGFTAYTNSVNFPSRHGVHANVAQQFYGQQISVTHVITGINYFVNIAAFTNGVAIRYEFNDGVTRNITAETTGFTIPTNSTVWFQTNVSVYEGTYGSTDISAMPANTVCGPPVTIQFSGTNGFMALTEANLGAFPNPYLIKLTSSRQLAVAYPINQDGTTGSTVTATATNTPWNVIMMGGDLNTIVNNDIVESLSSTPDPVLFPQGAVTSWATNGLSVWDYLNPFPGGITYTNAMTNSFWASQLGWPYNTVDAGWASWNGGNPWPLVSQVTSYSHAQGVKVIFLKTASEMNTFLQRTAFYKNLTNNGVDGIKIDFFDFNSVSAAAKERVQLRESILQEAAGYHLVITFHGTSKPTGQFRTYPNLMENEGVYGKEQFPGPFSESIPPFGRILAGPADFTPLALQGGLLSGKTKAFEIATVIAMPGPIITIAERSDIVATNPFAPLIKTIPSLWDETVVLSQSQLGQTTALARRKGSNWYLGVMNVTARNFGISLSFLSPNVTYQEYFIRDSSTTLGSVVVSQSNALAVLAAAGGGEAAWFYPIATNPPSLTLQSGSESSFQLIWNQGMLLEANDVTGPWTTNSGATSPFSVTPTQFQKFFRIEIP